ncbi:amino acid permease [Halonotius pteroides]|uniref:Amino acid transporter n=1 Tax=Halonotius pteroides TaxID=268735 RepID=A0A3A6QAA2_9EURY|nr:amino acid permease [Halonotius pteroides]RJX49912.1 amino acid transporter [Halonotius pteroides]
MAESQLDRTLGFTEAMTLGGGTMIGAGIFILPAIAAEGAGPASSISFGIAGFVALLAALSLAELATGMPISGGSYHYVNRGLGSFFGSIVGWGMWTGLMFASAFYMVGFGQYIVESVGFLDGRALIVLIGILGLGLIVGMNYYGTEESSGAQNLMIGTEFLIVLIYTGVGLFFIETAHLVDFAPTGPSGIVATTGTVFVTFLGFEIIATVAGEIKKPGKLIPLTMVLSVVGVTILYMLIMIVSTGVIPYQELGGSLVPVADVAVVFLGSIGVVAIVFAAVIAAISSSNSSILAASRVLFAMGRDNLMSDWLNATHDRFHTPHRAIIATGGVTAGLIGIGLEVEAIVALLAEVASFSFLVTYGLVHVSLVVFRRADPPAYDPDFAVPGLFYPIVPILGVALSVFVIAQMTRPVQIVGTGIVALGAIWYLVYARTNNVESGLLREALPGDESAYTVLVPVVNPQTQRGLLELAAATAVANADDGRAELVVLNVLRVAGDDRQNVEADRLDHQRDLLETARSTVAEMDVSLRTRALIGQDVGETILEEVKSEDADQVVVGWRGSFAGGEYAFGSNLDPVLTDAPADVTLASLGQLPVGNVTALVGDGPNTPVAVRRAAEFAARSEGNTQPTLLTVQLTDEETGAPEPSATARQQGREQITAVAQRAGLDPEEYTPSVLAGETVESAVSETLDKQDLVCLGLSDRSALRADRSGSIAEQIHERASCNVAIFERDTTGS